MSNFISNLFPSSAKPGNNMASGPSASSPASQIPQLQTRTSGYDGSHRPSTPTRANFITPVSTPQGSPSKKTLPPGAHDLPVAFENSLKLTAANLGSPTKIGRPAGTSPLSPGKSNALTAGGAEAGAAGPVDDSYFIKTTSMPTFDENAMQKQAATTPGSPLRKQGKENTPPSSRQGEQQSVMAPTNQAALSRQEQYQPRGEAFPPTVKKYNTQRGLTVEELEILHKPNVRRLANVTQLCKCSSPIPQGSDGMVGLLVHLDGEGKARSRGGRPG